MNNQTFEEFYLKYRKISRGYAYGVLHDWSAADDVSLKCTLCQGHYDFFLFRFLLYICLLCRGIKVMPLIDCFHLLL